MDSKNEKPLRNKRLVNKQLLVRQDLWNIIFETQNNNKLLDVLKFLRKRYPLRMSDGLIILGLFCFYGFSIALFKNYFYEALRTTQPYKLTYQPWAFFPWTYERQPKEPFIYPPDDTEYRDRVLYDEYEQRKENLIFKKRQQYDVTVRGQGERICPGEDHRQLDYTEYLSITKMNFDIMSLNLLKKNVNDELVNMGIYSDNKLYIKERLKMDYKSSEYMFKDDLYKELNSLVDI